MSLKMKLETLEGVDESLHGFYEEGENGYSLKVEGLEDTGALKRAKEHEKATRQAAEAKLAEAKAKLEEIEQNAARQSGDVESIEKSWKEKFSARETELNGQIETLSGKINNGIIDSEAAKLGAMAVDGSESVLAKFVRDRLTVDSSGSEPKLVILDEQGKPSALTVDEYREEIRNNPAFAPMLSASKATGSGANGDGKGGSASINWKTATMQEKVAHMKSKKGTK